MIVAVMDMNIIQQHHQQSCLSLAWILVFLAIITAIVIVIEPDGKDGASEK